MCVSHVSPGGNGLFCTCYPIMNQGGDNILPLSYRTDLCALCWYIQIKSGASDQRENQHHHQSTWFIITPWSFVSNQYCRLNSVSYIKICKTVFQCNTLLLLTEPVNNFLPPRTTLLFKSLSFKIKSFKYLKLYKKNQNNHFKAS